MYYASVWSRKLGFIQVKGRTWTALRKAVEAEMKKPGSRDWSSVCKHIDGWTIYKLGRNRTMDTFPLKEPKCTKG